MTKKNVKTYKATVDLQKKAGPGPLDMELVHRAQNEIDENKIDFAPIGLKFLSKLEKGLGEVKDTPQENIDEDKKKLIGPVMELKANAKIFHYELVGNLANIMLSFLETIKQLDKDALSIVGSHHDSLKAILSGNMKGDGGKDGKVMVTELQDACNRYYKKRSKKN